MKGANSCARAHRTVSHSGSAENSAMTEAKDKHQSPFSGGSSSRQVAEFPFQGTSQAHMVEALKRMLQQMAEPHNSAAQGVDKGRSVATTRATCLALCQHNSVACDSKHYSRRTQPACAVP